MVPLLSNFEYGFEFEDIFDFEGYHLCKSNFTIKTIRRNFFAAKNTYVRMFATPLSYSESHSSKRACT